MAIIVVGIYCIYTSNIFTDSTGLDIILQGIDDNDIMPCTRNRKI